ncbi:MAG: transposase [Actinomycetota bacterium]|nr:transposase [Actinomycetota bacterium]
MQRDGRDFTVEVTADGEGLVSHAGSALLAQVADKTGLTRALSGALARMRERRSGHDPGRVVRDLAVMLADGGDCLADLGAVRDQQPLFGAVASDSTAFRVIDRIACQGGAWRPSAPPTPARGPTRGGSAWAQAGASHDRPRATLIESHSKKQGAAGNFKGGFGHHPLLAYLDQTGEALGGQLRAGNAGANTAADQIALAEAALGQLPTEHVETIDVLLRTDSAGASHGAARMVSRGSYKAKLPGLVLAGRTSTSLTVEQSEVLRSVQ